MFVAVNKMRSCGTPLGAEAPLKAANCISQAVELLSEAVASYVPVAAAISSSTMSLSGEVIARRMRA